MKRKVLLAILALSLVCAWVSVGAAGQISYRMRGAEAFASKPDPDTPSSSAIAADAILCRPLGLVTTIAGTGVFLVTLPFSISSHSGEQAAWGLVGRPGGWTFIRPMGQGAPFFEEKGVFEP
jgi:hypothetical protein